MTQSAIPTSVTTGGFVSLTRTVRVFVTVVPPPLALYVIVYVPGTFVSTTPETWTGVDAPHEVAAAPASVYDPWQSTFAGLLPVSVIWGAD